MYIELAKFTSNIISFQEKKHQNIDAVLNLFAVEPIMDLTKFQLILDISLFQQDHCFSFPECAGLHLVVINAIRQAPCIKLDLVLARTPLTLNECGDLPTKCIVNDD